MPIPELDVLIASTLWLWRRGVRPLRISIAKGSAAGRYHDRRKLETVLIDAGIPRNSWATSSDGPDVIAVGAGQCWQVECKRVGSGVASTQRNNFDRALASVVSYYGNLPTFVSAECQGESLIALAVPPTADYMRELRRRVSPSLRRALNMWLLLCPSAGDVTPVSPDADLPS